VATADFPSNSHSKDVRVSQIEKLKAVPEPVEDETEDVKEPAEKGKESFEGKVFTRRKKLGPRLKRMFVDDGQNYAELLLESVIVPRLKDIGMGIVNMILSNIQRGAEDVFHPNGSSVNDVRSSRTHGPINYNDLHRSTTTIRRVDPVVARRQSNKLDDLAFEYRSDAQKVLTYIDAQIEEIGHCTVADLYDYVDPDKIQSTDDKWGWINVERAYIKDVGREGFLLVLPDPRAIHRR
jgi:hypothetical protein